MNGVRIARQILPEGPALDAPGSLMGDPAERARVTAYLRSGTAILFTTARAADRYAPGAGTPVGLSVRSDGDWVWSDAIGYYTATYGIAPDPGLLDHIRHQDYVCPPLDDEAARRALGAFYAAREG
jgi:hypothetical protein